MMTIYESDIPNHTFCKYLDSLINQFFKILPIKESGEPSLVEYMRSFQAELLGCRNLIVVLDADSEYITLLSILQYLIDNNCDTPVVKREVFKAISLCKRLKKKYSRLEGYER